MPLITTFCCCGGYFLLIQETLTPARAGIGQPQQPPQPPPSDQATVEDLELVEH
jgi:hypothetical protein